MKQPKKAIRQNQEYPGSYIWVDYAVKCPECGTWADDYGDVTQTDDNGDEHALCIPCGDKVFPAELTA